MSKLYRANHANIVIGMLVQHINKESDPAVVIGINYLKGEVRLKEIYDGDILVESFDNITEFVILPREGFVPDYKRIQEVHDDEMNQVKIAHEINRERVEKWIQEALEGKEPVEPKKRFTDELQVGDWIGMYFDKTGWDACIIREIDRIQEVIILQTETNLAKRKHILRRETFDNINAKAFKSPAPHWYVNENKEELPKIIIARTVREKENYINYYDKYPRDRRYLRFCRRLGRHVDDEQVTTYVDEMFLPGDPEELARFIQEHFPEDYLAKLKESL